MPSKPGSAPPALTPHLSPSPQVRVGITVRTSYILRCHTLLYRCLPTHKNITIMRHLTNWYSLAVILSLCLSSFAAAAYTPRNPSTSLPSFYQQATPARSAFSWLRDGLIRSIWSTPCDGQVKVSRAKAISAGPSAPPSTLLSRYGGDVVLRFNIGSAEEASALAEAVNVLFLDVWEFNSDWVDIRLSKDVVRSLTIGLSTWTGLITYHRCHRYLVFCHHRYSTLTLP